MVQIREKNKKIVALTQKKEEINSKIQQDVSEDELLALQKLHSELISEYEEIIKMKIDIFDDIIKNLKVINQGNTEQIQREMTHGEKKLQIEICERDNYQTNRVLMDTHSDIKEMKSEIQYQEDELAERKNRIALLENELEEAEAEKLEFMADL